MWNHSDIWGPIFVVCQFFTGSWGRKFVDYLVGEKEGGLKGKITPEKFILFETRYFSLKW